MSINNGEQNREQYSEQYGRGRCPADELVEADIVDGLSELFEDGEFEVLVGGPWAEPLGNENLAAVVWRYRTAPKETLIGSLLESVEIMIHGTTFVDSSGNSETFRRFIDWHSVYADLGMSGAARVVGEPNSVELDLSI